jgi:hypothetical protein
VQCFNKAENEGKGESEIKYKVANVLGSKEPAYEEQHAYYAANNSGPENKNVSFRRRLYFNNAFIPAAHFAGVFLKNIPLVYNLFKVQVACIGAFRRSR